MEVSLDLVRDVRATVERYTRRTPLLESAWLSEATGRRVLLKCENLQVTGSFKVRGALAALSRMDKTERERGVYTSSTGNHGQALAFAAQKLDVPCTVVVPRSAPANKVQKIRMRGARVIEFAGDGYDDAQEWTLAQGDELGGTYVSAFEDAAVIAGNGGTTALEIFEDEPDVDCVVVPVGGGGLIVGVGVVARAVARVPGGVRVVGVNPRNSAAMWLSREHGQAYTRLDPSNGGGPTIADGVEGGVGAENYRLAVELVDDVQRVSEEAIERAMRDVLLHEKLLVEGSGALGVAALLDACPEGKCLAVVLSGGNLDPGLLKGLL